MSPDRPVRNFAAVAWMAIIASAALGIWSGTFSCGGHVWHDQARMSGIVLAVLCVLLCRVHDTRRYGLRLAIATCAVAAYFIAEALSAPFYPSAPEASEYLRRVLSAFDRGAC